MPQNEVSINPSGPSTQGRRATEFHIPGLLKRVLPEVVIEGLREIKGRFLTRGFSRDAKFTLSSEDFIASASMSIVVPIHDAPTVTRRCLASLERFATEAEIILVDDGSRLQETGELMEGFGSRNEWKIVRNQKALGHSAACGIGAALATRQYLCLLNSDTVVTPWCWRLVKQAFESDDKIGAAGPSTSRAGTIQVLPLAAKLLPYWNDNQICDFAKRLLSESSRPVIVDLPWVAGFAFFIRHGLWQDLGGFDRNLPDYGNEVELCKRIAQKGFRSVWVRNSYIHHLGGQSYRETIGEEGIVARIQAARAYNKQNDFPAESLIASE